MVTMVRLNLKKKFKDNVNKEQGQAKTITNITKNNVTLI